MEINQAVILCGGRGTRLKPLTDSTPKPMIPVNSKPFLEYLLLQLKENKINKVLLLTGYKKEVIENYFGNGSQLGLEISYARGEEEWETAKRLHEAKAPIDNNFLLLYGDNFAQFNMQKIKCFHESKPQAWMSVTLYPKIEKNNISIDEEQKVINYDNRREDPQLKYIDIGYMVANKEIFNLIDGSNVSFSEIIKKLVEAGKLYGFVNADQYYSLTDFDRLKKAEEYLDPKKILIMDRDGVINTKAPKGEYITKWEDFNFVPGVLDFMGKMAQKGYSFIIVTNQAGITRGKFTVEDLNIVHTNMLNEMGKRGIKVLKIYYCPHHWEEKCLCRKPNPGMFFQASKDFKFRLDQSFYIGDDERDCLAAYNCNCRSIMYGDHYDKDYLSKYRHEYGCWPELFADDFDQIIQSIFKEGEKLK